MDCDLWRPQDDAILLLKSNGDDDGHYTLLSKEGPSTVEEDLPHGENVSLPRTGLDPTQHVKSRGSLMKLLEFQHAVTITQSHGSQCMWCHSEAFWQHLSSKKYQLSKSQH